MVGTVRLVSVVLVWAACMSGCSRCTNDMPLEHPEGLLPGYSQLTCNLWDYDSGVISFSYELPQGLQREAALDMLEARVSRSKWREGSHPLASCYDRRVRHANYLLTVCDNPGEGSPWAWEFAVEGSRLRVTTGGARYVLEYFLSQPPTVQ